MHKVQKNLRAKTKDKAKPKPIQTTLEGVVLETYHDEEPGFLRITVSKRSIDFEYYLVPFDDSPVTLFDTFSV